MPENIKKLFTNNVGMKISALLLAILIWAILSGREKTFSEKSLKIPVEILHVSENVEVVSLRPEEVTISIKGPSEFVAVASAESRPIKIDLKDIKGSNRLNYFAEDYLELPKGVELVSIHPKMIEVYVEEFATKEVPVKINFRGRLRETLKLKEARVNPERVTIISYQSRISDINAVWTEEVDLGAVSKGLTRRLALKQTRDILKFRDSRDVELQLEIEDRSQKK
jgi:YbbR domain-containing protein